ncbi:type IV pilus biogenesis/stability protein PilW [Stutzerimonas tarimensis]|uniref:Type IV pilus biogenesis/stability protein PilW n=1 Tax=Stutzerimonas tarimensis TaxID=1507735 RepID=A0ABV7T842_9GAMM
MSLRLALPLLLCFLAGCVSSGKIDPTRTPEGRNDARDAFVQLGIGYLQQGETARAKQPLGRALELDPRSADAHAALALVFQAEMEPELADRHFRSALAQSRDARILNNYGSFLFEQGRFKDAYERFQQAAEDTMYVERSRVFENLGLTAQRLGMRDQSQAHFNRALRLDSRRPAALLELASMAYEDREYVPARRYYENYIAMAPHTPRSLLLGIRLAEVFDEVDRGASFALQLRRLYPASAEYKTYLSEHQ